MHSPALALNWQIWGRHRWGLAAALLIVAGICAMPQAYSDAKLMGNVGDSGVPFMMAILMPFGFVLIYFAYAFSHAELGSRVRSSGFPLWMLTLPVHTRWLVVWPMVSGAVTLAATWLAVGWFALNKIGLEVPLVWPALGLACTLVWIQAVDWSTLGSIGKAVVAGAVLAGLWTGLMRDETHQATFVATPAILLLGYAAGVAGVSRARRGGRTQGSTARSAFVPALPWRQVRGRAFASPQRAQFWLEWRRNGTFLPLLAACWIAIIALFGLLSGGDSLTPMMGATIYLSLMVAPLAGLILGKPDVWSRQVRLPTFAAGRPLTCGDMVIAKLRMTALSLLAAWLILGLGFAIWLAWGSHSSQFLHSLERMSQESRTLKDLWLACALVGFFGFVLFLMAGTFVVSMTGRFWLQMAALFFYLAGLPNLLAIGPFDFLKDHLAEAGSVALMVKLLLAGWAFQRCYQRGILSGPAIAGLLAAWLATVGCALAADYLQYSMEGRADAMPVRDHLLALALFCPLFLVALAPIALAWNRHR